MPNMITVEQGTLAALSAVTSALMFTTKVLFAQSAECRASREKLQDDLLNIAKRGSKLEGLIEGCSKSGQCPLVLGIPSRDADAHNSR